MKIIGIILATNFDRNVNELVIRGSLPFFGKSIADITYELLENLNLHQIFVYTNSKGVALKNILGKKVKYIVRKNRYLYSQTALEEEFFEFVNDTNHMVLIDPKYPFLDTKILLDLLQRHLNEANDITYLKGILDNNVLIPNISVVRTEVFNQILMQLDLAHQSFDVNNVITSNIYKTGYIEIRTLHHIMPLANGKIIDNVEKLIKNRK